MDKIIISEYEYAYMKTIHAPLCPRDKKCRKVGWTYQNPIPWHNCIIVNPPLSTRMVQQYLVKLSSLDSALAECNDTDILSPSLPAVSTYGAKIRLDADATEVEWYAANKTKPKRRKHSVNNEHKCSELATIYCCQRSMSTVMTLKDCVFTFALVFSSTVTLTLINKYNNIISINMQTTGKS